MVDEYTRRLIKQHLPIISQDEWDLWLGTVGDDFQLYLESNQVTRSTLFKSLKTNGLLTIVGLLNTGLVLVGVDSILKRITIGRGFSTPSSYFNYVDEHILFLINSDYYQIIKLED